MPSCTAPSGPRRPRRAVRAGRTPPTGARLGQFQVHHPGRRPSGATGPSPGSRGGKRTGLSSAAASGPAPPAGGGPAAAWFPWPAHPGPVRCSAAAGGMAAVQAGRQAGPAFRPRRGRPARRPPLAGAAPSGRARFRGPGEQPGAAGGCPEPLGRAAGDRAPGEPSSLRGGAPDSPLCRRKPPGAGVGLPLAHCRQRPNPVGVTSSRGARL